MAISARIGSGATGGLVLGLAVLNRGYLAPYDTAVGQLVLLLVGAVFTVSFLWLAKMTRPSVTERFLVSTHELGIPDRASEIPT